MSDLTNNSEQEKDVNLPSVAPIIALPEMMPGEDLEAFVARINKDKPETTPKAPQSNRSGRNKKNQHDSTDPVSVVSPVDGDVFSAVHVYQRFNPDTNEREPEGTVRNNATHERRMMGPNVLVFCHLHSFGEPCVDLCREKIHDPNKDAM